MTRVPWSGPQVLLSVGALALTPALAGCMACEDSRWITSWEQPQVYDNLTASDGAPGYTIQHYDGRSTATATEEGLERSLSAVETGRVSFYVDRTSRHVPIPSNGTITDLLRRTFEDLGLEAPPLEGVHYSKGQTCLGDW